MKLISLVKKRVTLMTAACLSLSVGIGAEEASIINPIPLNTVPLYDNSEGPIDGTILIVPQFRTPDKGLHDGVLKLNLLTNLFEIVEYDYRQPLRFSGIQADPEFPSDIATQLEQCMNEVFVKSDEHVGVIMRVDVGLNSWRGTVGQSQMNQCCQEPRVYSNKFRIGSVTKVFVASVVLSLIEEGQLSLEDTLKKFQGEEWYSLLPDNSDAITIRDLLGMRSGIGSYTSSSEIGTSNWCTPRGVFTPEQLVKYGVDVAAPPLGDFNYSNTNYVLLGLIIESVTGKSLAENLQLKIFQPLQLFQTAFPNQPSIPYYFDSGYSSIVAAGTSSECAKQQVDETLPKIGDYSVIEMTYTSPSTPWAAGAMLSNMDDMVNAVKAQVTGKIPKLSSDLLNEREVTSLIRDATSNYLSEHYGIKSPIMYGLGIKEFDGYLGHDGEIFGYNSAAFYNPDKDIAIGVNMNVYPGNPIDALLLMIGMIQMLNGERSSCVIPEPSGTRRRDSNNALIEAKYGKNDKGDIIWW